MTNSSNELNNKLRHTLGWCLYTPTEEECQHLPANEDDEQTISELSALFTKQVQLGREQGFMGAKAGCSFNKDCKNCEANRLTLDYLTALPTTDITLLEGEK